MSVALHEESITRFGGTAGLRDVGLLEAVLARPKNLHAYDGVVDVPTLAAAYGFAVACNHPFVDGNKRAAMLHVAVFVALNGSRFDPDQVDEVTIVLGARRRNDRRARVRGVGRGTVLVSRQRPTSAP